MTLNLSECAIDYYYTHDSDYLHIVCTYISQYNAMWLRCTLTVPLNSAGRGLCHRSRSCPPTRTPGRSRDSRHQTRTTSTLCQRRSPRRRGGRQLEWRRSLQRRRGPCTRTQTPSTGSLPPRAGSCTPSWSQRRRPLHGGSLPGHPPRRRRSWQRCTPHQTSHGSGRWGQGVGPGRGGEVCMWPGGWGQGGGGEESSVYL